MVMGWNYEESLVNVQTDSVRLLDRVTLLTKFESWEDVRNPFVLTYHLAPYCMGKNVRDLNYMLFSSEDHRISK